MGGSLSHKPRNEPAHRISHLFGRVVVDRGVPESAYDGSMRSRPKHPRSDQQLVQIVDAAVADAARRSGAWLLCRPGCSQCCVGVFAISRLDAQRLREGLENLQVIDPERATRVRARARQSVEKLSKDFPGDCSTGLLEESEEAEERFAVFANDEPCPALDPGTGTCDLYHSRPMTCRVFGPPVRSGEGIGVCELCFVGATPEQIAACELKVDPDALEAPLLRRLERESGVRGQTLVAFALR